MHISLICNVEVSLFSVNIIKLGILSFLSSHIQFFLQLALII